MHHTNHKFDPKDLLIDFPRADELAIYWAEKMELDLSAPYFGWGPTPWDIMDLRLTMRGDLIHLMKSLAEEITNGLRLVFFLPNEFDLAPHIMEIRSSDDEAKMMSTWRKVPYDPYVPAKMDILLFKDHAALAAMTERSPSLGLLQDVTAGQSEDEAWVYFLSRPKIITDGGWGYQTNE
jgi:hypothetical protein